MGIDYVPIWKLKYRWDKGSPVRNQGKTLVDVVYPKIEQAIHDGKKPDLPDGYRSRYNAIIDLRNDIAKHGLKHPLEVIAVKDDAYYVIVGNQRLCALRTLPDYEEVPCEFVDSFNG